MQPTPEFPHKHIRNKLKVRVDPSMENTKTANSSEISSPQSKSETKKCSTQSESQSPIQAKPLGAPVSGSHDILEPFRWDMVSEKKGRDPQTQGEQWKTTATTVCGQSGERSVARDRREGTWVTPSLTPLSLPKSYELSNTLNHLPQVWRSKTGEIKVRSLMWKKLPSVSS